jgi:hypothetical protein
MTREERMRDVILKIIRRIDDYMRKFNESVKNEHKPH